MVYTPEEKRKMDNVLQAFAQYTANHTEFDIAYSEKTGYVRLIIATCADQVFFPLNSFDDLLDMFCMEIVSDEIKKQLETNSFLKAKDIDYDIIRLRLQRYIDQLEEDYQTQALRVVGMHIQKNAMNLYIP